MAIAVDDPRLAHGLGGFTRGCRCATCRSARKDYDAERRARQRAEREAQRAELAASRREHPTTTATELLLARGWSWVQVASIDWWTPAQLQACVDAHGGWSKGVRQAVDVLAEAMKFPHEQRAAAGL